MRQSTPPPLPDITLSLKTKQPSDFHALNNKSNFSDFSSQNFNFSCWKQERLVHWCCPTLTMSMECLQIHGGQVVIKLLPSIGCHQKGGSQPIEGFKSHQFCPEYWWNQFHSYCTTQREFSGPYSDFTNASVFLAWRNWMHLTSKKLMFVSLILSEPWLVASCDNRNGLLQHMAHRNPQPLLLKALIWK
jgi:hypothetical protein